MRLTYRRKVFCRGHERRKPGLCVLGLRWGRRARYPTLCKLSKIKRQNETITSSRKNYCIIPLTRRVNGHNMRALYCGRISGNVDVPKPKDRKPADPG